MGSKYTDEEWSQKLITVNDFIDRYIIGTVRIISIYFIVRQCVLLREAVNCLYLIFLVIFFQAEDGVGYLAQHQLFDQVRCFSFLFGASRRIVPLQN